MIDPVVDLRWLSAHRDEVVVADVRWYLDGRSGREAFMAGHIPGSIFVDLDRDLAGPASPEQGRHPLPSPEQFAKAMAARGISDASVVVAYDDSGGSTAARLVWMLRVLGGDAAVLDGGLEAWHGPLEGGGGAKPAVAHRSARPWPSPVLASVPEVGAASVAAGGGSEVVVDARDPARYRGEVEPVDPRAGHIPGAVNLPWRGNLGAAGRFLPPDRLRERFAALGESPIVYCGSGVTACHNLVAMERAGITRARLYPGSWSQWSADPSRPAVTGPDPG